MYKNMKKLLSFVSLLFCAIFASAAVDVETTDNVVYLENTTAQLGSSAKINVMLKAENTIGSVKVIFEMPEGVTIDETPVSPDAFVTWNENEYILVLGKGDPYYSTGVMATLNVNIAPTAKLGENEMKITYYSITEPSLATYEVEDDEVVSTLTIQKTAVIEPLTDGYSLEVLPFVAKEGNSTIDVLFKSAAAAKSVTFDIELPQGMMFYDENFDPSKPVLNASACTKTPTTTLTVTDETYANKATVSVMGQNTGAAALRKYINKLDELTTLVSIPVYVVPSDEIADWGDDYALNEGVYEAKLNNIVVTDYESNATFTGNYLASVIFGQPAEQEALLYGYYDKATADAFTAALKNVVIANTTGAKFADDAFIEDVILTNERSSLSIYSRSSENFATTVLPYDLESGPNCQLYTALDMTSESITIEEADYVAANTPCIFKGIITGTGEGEPAFGVIPEQYLGLMTFKGTYVPTEIAAGAGYYISSNGKFYGDGAKIRPFRAYFEGSVSGAKSLRVLLRDETGVKDITNQLSDEAIYSLQGVKMNNAQKGVNIINGKKVYIK